MQQFIRERTELNELRGTSSMTYVYGATLRGTASHIEEMVYAGEVPGVSFPEGARTFVYAQYAARKLFQGIAATVPAAASAMAWLQDIATQQPKGKRMEWKSPSGFLVQHDYQDCRETQVFIRSCGLKNVLVREYTDGTNPRQMRNAIAPNFVHALDATHLTLTTNAMKELGLCIVGIHDSFGTHLCDVTTMHKTIREQFVRMYSKSNVLTEFLWDIGNTAEPPMRGTLDINEVLNSEFFFC